MRSRVLILGGTAEARGVAAALAGRPELEVVSSLAGRVRSPILPAGQVRIGGFGGAAGLRDYLRAERVDAVVDATHPFASTITASAASASADVGVPLIVLRRAGWTEGPGDRWHWVRTLDEAAAVLPPFGPRVFLTTGRTGLAAFAGLDGHWFLIRTVEPPEAPLPRRYELLSDRGPFQLSGERELLARHRIDVLVSKDSGGPMTSAKLTAARERGIPVILQRRPALPDVASGADVDEVLEWLDTTLASPSPRVARTAPVTPSDRRSR
ncbi:MAG TPA: cobalt-precorrin-6A reductase [Pseudonocardia sp.]|jgi:precorrin-6A/cobalt-precorrin-6A reductase|nr:cobalt-precorrin-6A reductase [Pseudonocardia sp.]